MCGIAGLLGGRVDRHRLRSMVDVQRHRGPDEDDVWIAGDHAVGLGHARLRILDLTAAGRQPMATPDGRYHIVFNGEVYNFLELRATLGEERFRTGTDTEVVLHAFARWGAGCLDRFLGMFAFAVWDEQERQLFAARDRFGVKPFHYALLADGTFAFSSEIKALHAAGLPAEPDEATWATYLAHGLLDSDEHTFWQGAKRLEPGSRLTWQAGRVDVRRWYDLPGRVGDAPDLRPSAEVEREYTVLLEESVRLRFRADVPVGINLSGGLDSSLLLALVHQVQGEDSDVKAFTFVTGDEAYDESPWVDRTLARTRHPHIECALSPAEVPALQESVQRAQDEPAGGLPTLAYARLFEQAREHGVTVLLDGQGMDEQWGGYDYYRTALEGGIAGTVQGTKERPVKPECLDPHFRARARRPAEFPASS